MVDEIKKTLEEQMSLARAGDNFAYERLLKEITPLIRNFVAKFNYYNLIDGDALAQDILLAIHNSSHTYQEGRSFRNWIFAIANYKVKDELRKIYRRKKITEVNFADVENILFEEVDFDFEKKPTLASMLYVLKPKQQKIVKLLKIECNSLEEVANEMQMTVAAVKVAAHRSYKILTEKFGKK